MEKDILDFTTDGLILLNSEGNIESINYTAKKILGLTGEYTQSHSEGRIEKGDIVIFCTNRLGEDDGVMESTFNRIGLKEQINMNKPYAIVGVMGGETEPYVFSIEDDTECFQEKITYLETSVEIIMNFNKHTTLIKVEDYIFPLDYIYAIGNVVILDGDTKKVKFFQSRGYTIREENVEDVLQGKSFYAKKPGSESINIIGYNLNKIIKCQSIKSYLIDGVNLKHGENHFDMIHSVPVLVSHYTIQERGKHFKLLRLVDLSTFYKTIQEQSNALKTFHRLCHSKQTDANPLPGFVGMSTAIEKVKEQAMKAANTTSTVLIMGESGTGKSQLAQLIHYKSSRKNRPFIHVNCASLPASIIESELFGYEPGAFTGAHKYGKKGLFELADTGTIFLDEIGELSTHLQTKLLKVLQEQSFYRVGGENEIKVNVRIIAATNRDLIELVKSNLFREDLYYRLFIVPIYIAPLRERREDITELIWFLLPRICTKMNIDMRYLSEEAFLKLKNYDYPGNIRELENILERAMNLCEGIIIQAEDINYYPDTKNKDEWFLDDTDLKTQLKMYEKKIIESTIKMCAGDSKKAMKILNIKKSSFYEKIHEYNISP